jgi:hypothetical protein
LAFTYLHLPVPGVSCGGHPESPLRGERFSRWDRIVGQGNPAGYQAAEVPAVLYKRMYGVSKARIIQTIFSHLRFQFWVMVQRIRMIFGLKIEEIGENRNNGE